MRTNKLGEDEKKKGKEVIQPNSLWPKKVFNKQGMASLFFF